jgi:hypothetical protein
MQRIRARARCRTGTGGKRPLRAIAALVIATAAVVFSSTARAVPLFARQTGQQCAACHNGFPELTPYGRLFKLSGYTFGGGQSVLPPVSAMMVASFTNTQQGQAGGAAPHFAPNNNFAYEFASLFYGGVLLPHVGLFGQITYDNIGKSLGWDNTDLRIADTFKVLETEVIAGISINNNPTVQDVWNTVPAWRYPWQSSGLAPTPTASTLIEGGLAGQVVGVTAYGFWDRMIFAEVGGYRTLGSRLQYQLGVNPGAPNTINGVAPYWRLAVEPKWGLNSLEIGTFGLAAAQVPGGMRGNGTDHLTDVGFDTQYQYLGYINSVSLQASWIHENEAFAASELLGISSNTHDHLDSVNVKATYAYDQTYAGTIAWFDITGTQDALLYGSDSATNSPNSSGWIGEVDYTPFNHGGPSWWPWLNVRFGLQYTYYTRFNGGTTNYDGAGTNATANNTLYLFSWLAF